MKNIFKIQVIILIIIELVAYTNISVAASKKELQNEKSDINSAISEAEDELDDLSSQKSETLNQVQNLITQISSYESEISDLETEISDLKEKISDAEKRIKEDEEEYQRQQDALNERLVVMYEQGETSYLDVLLSSSSLTDFISTFYLVSELTSYDNEMLKQVADEKQKIENEKQELENDKSKLDTAKASKEQKVTSLASTKKEKENKAKELSEEEKKTQQEIEQLEADKAEIDKQLKKIAEEELAEAKRKAEEEAKRNKNNSSNNSGSSGGSSTPSASGYIFPVAGLSKANIRNKTYPSYAGHTGVDINIGVVGKSVVAVKDGTVDTSKALKNADGSYRSYGEYIIINHHDGTMTLYGHLLAGSRRVSENQTVKQGQVIGTVGSTGNSTGPHLHFEVRTLATYYKPVNPLPYLP